jgi:hypothetical protein
LSYCIDLSYIYFDASGKASETATKKNPECTIFAVAARYSRQDHVVFATGRAARPPQAPPFKFEQIRPKKKTSLRRAGTAHEWHFVKVELAYLFFL